MKDIQPINPDDIPKPVMDALTSPPEDIIYCNHCDGLRRKDHQCVCAMCRSTILDPNCPYCKIRIEELAEGKS